MMTPTTTLGYAHIPPMVGYPSVEEPRTAEEVQTMLIESPVIRDADGTVTSLVHWRHRRGGHAHCLARLYPASGGRVVALISELASNPNDRGIASDFAAVADEVLRIARDQIGVEPDRLIWLAHHGAFSVAGAFDPETFTLVPLTWAQDGYVDDLHTHRLLHEAAVHQVLSGITPRPVLDAVDALQRH
jgi:hypothetical protein